MRPLKIRRLFFCSVLVLLGLLSGCATHIDTAEESGVPQLRFQRPTLAPAQGERPIDLFALEIGDIVLTADDRNGVSLGIRLFSLSTVSHAALYLGEDQFIEAVHSGVRLRSSDEMKGSQSVIAAYRYPGLTSEQRELLRLTALQRLGNHYNFAGVTMQAPFMFTRHLCAVPGLPDDVRHQCARALAWLQMAPLDPEGLFCSEFVAETYRNAGVPLTNAESRWISPSDLLHMREGDVSEFKASLPLVYVGHLKARPATANLAERDFTP